MIKDTTKSMPFMSHFTDPPPNCETYCDACGAVFMHHNQIVYRCDTCKKHFNSDYELCKRCYANKKHHKHTKAFTKLRFQNIGRPKH